MKMMLIPVTGRIHLYILDIILFGEGKERKRERERKVVTIALPLTGSFRQIQHT